MAVMCPCGRSIDSPKIDVHKHIALEDENLLGKMDIYQCNSCGLSFTYPMPPIVTIEDYYINIYRKEGRAHFVANPNQTPPGNWQKSQYSYISLFTNLDLINNVIDIGAGYGFLLREINRQHKHLNLYTSELDTKACKYLSQYGIKNIELNDNLELPEFDLCISSHNLEHFTDPNDFIKIVKSVLKKNGHLFLEIPNCPFEPGKYLERLYDGPHLLFFTLDSLKHLLEKHNFEIIHIASNGWDFQKEIELMKNEYLPKTKANIFIQRLREFIKNLLPQFILNWVREKRNNDFNSLEESFYHYGGNRWTIRCFARLK